MPNTTQNALGTAYEGFNRMKPRTGNRYENNMAGLSEQVQSGKINWYDFYQNLNQQRYAEILDFNSPMYKEYGQYLNKYTPRMGTDSILSALTAGGGGTVGAQNMAAETVKADNVRRQDTINQSVMEFALGNQGQANSLLQLMMGGYQGQQQATLQNDLRRDANNPWSQLANIFAGFAGQQIGSMGGGKEPGMKPGKSSPPYPGMP